MMTWNTKDLMDVMFFAQADMMKRIAEGKKSDKQTTGLLRAEIERLGERNERLFNALCTLADGAGDDPMFNKGGEAYEAMFGEEE
tara:strand:+ start:218 stop:472 length:255 start_codon:yes stop_codon:yes gene_type:complete